jgi:hypothetical protein|tara:strand:+ start:1727 stop:2200 length:474 start_codon:yes stop_codon:yes gene_type:complete
MSKWDRLIEYLETTNAKPDKVLASVKAVFKPKGQSKIEYTDSYITRKAYTALTCHAIYNAKKDNPKASLDYIIRDLLSKDSFKINYQMTHLIKKRNPKTKKMEYYGDDKSFSKKDSNKLYNSVKKIWTTNKDIRKALEKSDGRSVGPIAKNLKDSLK